jgi:hypothetical protein
MQRLRRRDRRSLKRVEVEVDDPPIRDPPAAQTLGDELEQAGLARTSQAGEDLDDWGVYEGFDPIQIQRTVNQVHTHTPPSFWRLQTPFQPNEANLAITIAS